VSLFDKRLILVGGKGGVGRSTTAAAIASACARRGRKTLLFEANANDRFGQMFGAAPVGSKVTQLAPNLSAVNTNPAAALEEYGLMILKFQRVYNLVFENRLTKAFLRAIPGLDDYAVLGKAWYHTTEEKRGKPVWDTVVLDMPASGHSMSLLRIPWVIGETVPEGPLTNDARTIRELLTDQRRTALLLVTLPEEMPANEARELSQALSTRLGLTTQQLVVNQVYPDRFPAGSPSAQVLEALLRDDGGDPDLFALAAHGRLAQGRRQLNERYLKQLAETLPVPRVELPLLFAPSIGQAELGQLAAILEAGVG
jgi:anion-transporting  ArsA/GET3 family ATPase